MKIGLVDSGRGVIPFVEEILMQNKINEYYIYIDSKNFPYGNKSSEELGVILVNIFSFFESKKIDLLLICCNTLSLVYSRVNIKTSFEVKSILLFNLKRLNGRKLLVTEYVYKKLKDYPLINGKNLASAIEENSIKKQVKIIRSLRLKENIVLGCTHYSICLAIFQKEYPSLSFESYHKEFIYEIPSSKKRKFYVNKNGVEVFKKYLPLLSIKVIKE